MKIFQYEKNLILIFCCSFFVIISCSNTKETISLNKNNNENASIQNSSQIKNQSDSIEIQAKFDNYNYNYKKDGEKTVALFTEKFLPRDDKVVVGAIRHIIKESYKDDVKGFPSLKNYGGINKIHLESRKSNYYVTPVKEDTGEIHSLVIEREAK